MSKKTALAIMAAGMGSRFGGLKQMAPLGPEGQVIIDYSVYDAVRAGFDQVVLIIKKENEADFREVAGKRIERLVDVRYVFQNPHDLPGGFALPEGRLKPWGTGHAVLSARRVIDTPFAVINADDYYGAESYRLIHECLVSDAPECMVGFELGKTLTESGTVSRGVCTIRDGYLESVVEHTALDKNSGLPLDTVVSMNLWGFSPAIMETLERGFAEFLTAMPDPMKSEFYLPAVVDREIRERGARYRVLRTPERWYGVTYREDAEGVRRAIAEMTAAGKYPTK
ncbi:MAG: NTP transferase domain-containing protein [Clostridia bacterium]|nr:NTP transferase domain-containing protein [Clostridia bacterium]